MTNKDVLSKQLVKVFKNELNIPANEVTVAVNAGWG